MGRFEHSKIIHWPPAGWPEFASVSSSAGRALAKDVFKARIYGLNYSIESVPIFKMDTQLFRHDVLIEGWDYSILNESNEYPVLSFSLYDRFDDRLDKECFVTDIRSYSAPIPHTRRSVSRSVSAALYLIRQIDANHVPDIDRVLRAYKLHPQQAYLYREDKNLETDLKTAFRAGITRAAGDQRL